MATKTSSRKGSTTTCSVSDFAVTQPTNVGNAKNSVWSSVDGNLRASTPPAQSSNAYGTTPVPAYALETDAASYMHVEKSCGADGNPGGACETPSTPEETVCGANRNSREACEADRTSRKGGGTDVIPGGDCEAGRFEGAVDNVVTAMTPQTTPARPSTPVRPPTPAAPTTPARPVTPGPALPLTTPPFPRATTATLPVGGEGGQYRGEERLHAPIPSGEGVAGDANDGATRDSRVRFSVSTSVSASVSVSAATSSRSSLSTRAAVNSMAEALSHRSLLSFAADLGVLGALLSTLEVGEVFLSCNGGPKNVEIYPTISEKNCGIVENRLCLQEY